MTKLEQPILRIYEVQKIFQVKINSSSDFVFSELGVFLETKDFFRKTCFFNEIFNKLTYIAYLY